MTLLKACFGNSANAVCTCCQIVTNWNRSGRILTLSLSILIIISSCKSRENTSAPSFSNTTNQVNELPSGSPMGSLCIQALQGKSDFQIYSQLLQDQGLTSILSNHPQFDFVFFVFPDSSIKSVSQELQDAVLSSQFNDTKYKFFANHVSMTSKGMPWVTGTNFNEIRLDLKDNEIIFNNKSVKILEKLPSHERIQVYIISNPINS